MTKIVAISGSLRKDSWNTKVLRAIAGLAPEGVAVSQASIRGIPLYDGDVEAESGLPDAVVSLQDEIAGADGLLIVSPEYNGGIPGVAKNAIDWLSRGGGGDRVFKDRPTALCGATPGRSGTRSAQNTWLPVLRNLGVDFWGGSKLYLDGISRSFDEDGQLDETIAGLCRDFIEGFAAYVRREGRE